MSRKRIFLYMLVAVCAVRRGAFNDRLGYSDSTVRGEKTEFSSLAKVDDLLPTKKICRFSFELAARAIYRSQHKPLILTRVCLAQ
ncbi:hypothetical protein BDY19DRAFT_150711 [Irpex rosettiformis]|uniref:Uncharacterized protein n=1 Tax=Irpex rosettiformis TaxID=378272 RepID=A0ACB8U3F2_9APHY|nr:hypothetical protein BDY19DRAFT_150711 [Irpex rosettiformis]